MYALNVEMTGVEPVSVSGFLKPDYDNRQSIVPDLLARRFNCSVFCCLFADDLSRQFYLRPPATG